jgi:deoxyribodipyrimidine photo-lyase
MDHMALFLFRRDLRLRDNTAFNAALRWCRKNDTLLICAFEFPEAQINRTKNPYFSNAAVQFMCESLAELDGDLRALGTHLHMYTVKDHTQILEASKRLRAVFLNHDYSVYAGTRDTVVETWCKAHDVEFHGHFEDYDLISLNEGLIEGRPYTNLSQYFAKFTKGHVTVRAPETVHAKKSDFVNANAHIGLHEILADSLSTLYTPVENLAQHGGRVNGLKVLQKNYSDYAEVRDNPALDKTTKASAHLHFGTISCREMYHAVNVSALQRELVFRSFYLKIYALRPELQRGTAFRTEVDSKIKWMRPTEAREAWKAWINSTTGYPLVDAGMRQLHATGWMHNRVRMVVASFITRYAMIDWRDCAKFFYTRLVDADTFSNTAGWQWAAGIGPDAAPYFRAPLNPFIQSKKFDTNAEYIKRWLPELQDVDPKDIHRWGEKKIRDKYPTVKYTAPIVDQSEASQRAVRIMKQAHN